MQSKWIKRAASVVAVAGSALLIGNAAMADAPDVEALTVKKVTQVVGGLTSTASADALGGPERHASRRTVRPQHVRSRSFSVDNSHTSEMLNRNNVTAQVNVCGNNIPVVVNQTDDATCKGQQSNATLGQAGERHGYAYDNSHTSGILNRNNVTAQVNVCGNNIPVLPSSADDAACNGQQSNATTK